MQTPNEVYRIYTPPTGTEDQRVTDVVDGVSTCRALATGSQTDQKNKEKIVEAFR